MSVNTTVNITGMTCGHCVASVMEELQALKGLQDVAVTLNKGGISVATIVSAAEISPAEIGEAVAEAGYTVVATNA